MKTKKGVDNIVVIIPSLNPDARLVSVIQSMLDKGFRHLVVVDDGSGPDYRPLFEQAEQMLGHPVITHSINLGKGRALKTAFNHVLKQYPDCAGVVTVDADNQHCADDVVRVCDKMIQNPKHIVFGVRNFNQQQVPIKSRYGNQISRLIFQALCGIKLSDTQTGLRAIPLCYLPTFLTLPGERFEYETNMLLELKIQNIEFSEVKIETIYIDDNASTHFHPLLDSVRIYTQIIKFASASAFSALLDFVLFFLLTFLFSFALPQYQLLIATSTARICSSLFNYISNKHLVFKNKQKSNKTIIKYYALVVTQMLASYFGILWVTQGLGAPLFWTKILVDFILFLVSFQIQREWVFKNK